MWLAAKRLEIFHAFSKKNNLIQIKCLNHTIFIYYVIFQHQVIGKAHNVNNSFYSLIYSLKDQQVQEV